MNRYNDDMEQLEHEAEAYYDDYLPELYEDEFDELEDMDDEYEYDPYYEDDPYEYDLEYDGYDDYDGYDEYYEEDYGYPPQPLSYADSYIPAYEGAAFEDDGYDSYVGKSIGRINPNDRTITVTVINTGATPAEAIIFGANENAAQPVGITVNVQESSHAEVREDSKSNPFTIMGMKMTVSDPLQLDNILKLVERSSAGKFERHVYQPRSATSPQNFNGNMIDDNTFEFEVTGKKSIRLDINPGVTVVFTFTIVARANMSNVLRGRNVAEMSRAPRKTGLPQIDLLQQRRRLPFGMHAARRRGRPVRGYRTHRPPQARTYRPSRPPRSPRPPRRRRRFRIFPFRRRRLIRR